MKNKLPNTTSNLVEQIDDTNSEENLDFELLPDLNASNELEEGNSNEINMYVILKTNILYHYNDYLYQF